MPTYRVSVKRTLDGHFYARCETAPAGMLERTGDTEEEAVARMRAEIEYQLEWCPCTGAAREKVHLDVVRRECSPQVTGVMRPKARR